uniref:Reverse transcriptase Ty1/copia-type domain-containing protein n=1 Tax=Tanacetum cinerariifolium TaxID=118510 RepID=A0A6L2NWS0_TANCI|nr:hypothetical protein [Tanacetum cinerariifolium]
MVGFAQNLDEPCVYQKASGSNVTFLILYVDDIIIMGNHIPSLQSVKDYLGKCFAMKDLGEAAFILGIKIYRYWSKRLIRLGQNDYMDKILKRYKMDNFKRGHIPMQEKLDLNKTQGASTPKEVKRMQNVPYALVVGSIIYAVRCTRPDVAFTQNITSRFHQNPGELHWTAVKNIRNGQEKFQAKYTVMYATEAEYIAASEATMEAVWIRKFILALGIVPTINEPTRMFGDNSAALHFANEPRVQKGARHYHRRYHYVHENIALGEIRFFKVHTYDNLADLFTKALSKGRLTQHARSMGLRLASSFIRPNSTPYGDRRACLLAKSRDIYQSKEAPATAKIFPSGVTTEPESGCDHTLKLSSLDAVMILCEPVDMIDLILGDDSLGLDEGEIRLIPGGCLLVARVVEGIGGCGDRVGGGDKLNASSLVMRQLDG